jgi:nicotinamide/nicotinate riboside kinase
VKLQFQFFELTILRLPTKDGLLDWDCAEALEIPAMVKSLEHIHQNGTFPVSIWTPHNQRSQLTGALTLSQPDLDSKEDQNSIGACPVPDATIKALKARVKTWTESGNSGHGILDSSPNPICLWIFDGFLLYSKSMEPIQPQIDIKFFLRVSYAKAKARREARSGYVTLEGFWEDPPGYVDKIVWPNYVEDHKWMFENEDVEGKLKEDVVKQWAIKCQDGGVDVDMTTTLEWAVDTLMEQLPLLAKSS